MAKSKTLFATTCAAVLMGFANLAGSNVVEQAPAGSGYDLVAHVRNTPTYGYNPQVPTDAAALACGWPGNTVEDRTSLASASSTMRSMASPAKSPTTSFFFVVPANVPVNTTCFRFQKNSAITQLSALSPQV
jgi:hypothetical protein